MKVDKAKVLVEKIGRKWIQVKVNDSRYSSNLEINPITSGFEVGETYELLCNFDYQKSKFGTKLFLYPIREDDFKEQKTIGEITKGLKYYKYDKFEEIKALINTLEESKQSELLELLEKEHEKATEEKLRKDIQYQVKALTWNYESLRESKVPNLFTKSMDSLETKLDKAYHSALELNKLKRTIDEDYSYNFEREREVIASLYKRADIGGKHRLFNTCKKYINTMDMHEIFANLQEENESAFVNILNKELDIVYLEAINIELLSETHKKQYQDLLLIDSTNQDIARNIFNIKPESVVLEELYLSLHSGMEYAKKVLKDNKDIFAPDGLFYGLNIQLELEDFKNFIKSGALLELDCFELRGLGKYYTKTPGIIYNHLIDKGLIDLNTIKQYKENSEEIDDINTISLLSNIWKPFNYRKEVINGQIYYLVDKDMLNGKYKAYYIVSNDDELDKGFTHRLPYRENFYENLTIQEILDDTFLVNEGFLRLQGDLIFRDLGEIHTDHYEKIVTSEKINLLDSSNAEISYIPISRSVQVFKNGKLMSEEEIENSPEIDVFASLQNTYKKQFEYKRVEQLVLRKNTLYLNGEVYSICDSELLCKNFEITNNKGEVVFNKNEETLIKIGNHYTEGYKFKYNIRIVEDIKKEIKTLKEKHSTENSIIKGDKNNLNYKLEKFRKEHELISTHTVSGMLKGNYRGHLNNSVFALGKFSVIHPEHKSVQYGEDNHIYEIRIAKKHRCN